VSGGFFTSQASYLLSIQPKFQMLSSELSPRWIVEWLEKL
jgi:hypothetical protein